MAPEDHPEAAAATEGAATVGPSDPLSESESESEAGSESDSHWVRWHEHYEDPTSPLSLRLQLVQSMVRGYLDAVPPARPGPIRIVSMCAGQGRDVIDVVSTHPRADDVSALLVELDPALVAFARDRAGAAGVAPHVRIVQGDASLCRWYEADVPADLVLVCGVFGNISPGDITRTIQALPGFCRVGSEVIWTRHRRPPDATPAIRADFAAAGFTELAFEAPDGYVLTVGRHRLDGGPDSNPGSNPSANSSARTDGGATNFDPAYKLFDFVGDGGAPA